MGKKKGASTSDAAKVSRDWSASAICSRDINKLRNLGFISTSDEDIRLPGAVSRPKPPKGFTVMFVAFLFRGLSLPAHEFLRSLLFFYGIQLWQLTPNSILHLYHGKDDESRVSSVDLSADDLRDEVRRLTCLSVKDNIVLMSARSPYDSQHLPAEVPAVAECYPPILESGVEPEDDNDNSEETEDAQHTLEDSDVREEEATEDDAFLRSRRRKQVHDEFITTAESSPSGQDNDAVEAAPPPSAKATSTSFFALEDDLDFSDDDDEVPLAKRAKSTLGRKAPA
ncbi:hypothetical protein QYE76_068376 [Lolium multiflorum]|uniref:Transposase (putative) gypsy type domain-containing protein n=1 Tax=Lolium multiflorum TaxID=4521 RepID=A0AAD8SEA2_LOLMU|nr:hypothetical protein QYE76_068376 [Lolium multiflorum]